MTTQTLTPTQTGTDGTGVDLTSTFAAATQTTLQFGNSGREVLFVNNGDSGAHTVTVDIGATVDGQAVTNFTAVSVPAGHIKMFGPFHSVLDQPGGTTMQVVLDATTSITLALIQYTPVS